MYEFLFYAYLWAHTPSPTFGAMSFIKLNVLFFFLQRCKSFFFHWIHVAHGFYLYLDYINLFFLFFFFSYSASEGLYLYLSFSVSLTSFICKNVFHCLCTLQWVTKYCLFQNYHFYLWINTDDYFCHLKFIPLSGALMFPRIHLRSHWVFIFFIKPLNFSKLFYLFTRHQFTSVCLLWR